MLLKFSHESTNNNSAVDPKNLQTAVICPPDFAAVIDLLVSDFGLLSSSDFQI